MTHKEYQRCRRTVKHFHKGDIVYWIRSAIDSKHKIMWGVVDAEIAECKRISNLSDYDYAVWDMDDRLSKWRTPNMSDEFITEIREWLLKLDDFEDYEFRGTSGGFQYKKANNKKWLTVGISTDRSRW